MHGLSPPPEAQRPSHPTAFTPERIGSHPTVFENDVTALHPMLCSVALRLTRHRGDASDRYRGRAQLRHHLGAPTPNETHPRQPIAITAMNGAAA